MSVECSLALVDWEEFQHEVDAAGSMEDVLEELEFATLGIEALEAQDYFLNSLDAMASRWSSPSATALTELTGILFWSWRGKEQQVFELDGGADEARYPMVDSAWSPETVQKLAARWKSIDITECAAHFDAAGAANDAFPSSNAFIAYAKEWGGHLVSAAQDGLGIVVFVFG